MTNKPQVLALRNLRNNEIQFITKVNRKSFNNTSSFRFYPDADFCAKIRTNMPLVHSIMRSNLHLQLIDMDNDKAWAMSMMDRPLAKVIPGSPIAEKYGIKNYHHCWFSGIYIFCYVWDTRNIELIINIEDITEAAGIEDYETQFTICGTDNGHCISWPRKLTNEYPHAIDTIRLNLVSVANAALMNDGGTFSTILAK